MATSGERERERERGRGRERVIEGGRERGRERASAAKAKSFNEQLENNVDELRHLEEEVSGNNKKILYVATYLKSYVL